jgi:hypothetical protein
MHPKTAKKLIDHITFLCGNIVEVALIDAGAAPYPSESKFSIRSDSMKAVAKHQKAIKEILLTLPPTLTQD